MDGVKGSTSTTDDRAIRRLDYGSLGIRWRVERSKNTVIPPVFCCWPVPYRNSRATSYLRMFKNVQSDLGWATDYHL